MHPEPDCIEERQYDEQWNFSQCFGDKSDTLDVADADIISTVSFDQTGQFLASGDRAGRVVLFERHQENKKRPFEYRFYSEFQSHEPEFDYLKSLEINEKINKICWCPRQNDAHLLLTTNDKTIKLWKIKDRQVQQVVENNSSVAEKLQSSNVQLPIMLPKLSSQSIITSAQAKRVYANAHAYHIHSISLNSDHETFLSSDDLRVNLWHLDNIEESFNVVDLKPTSIEELTEVITTAKFHPAHCNLFAYGTSKGYVRMCDLRSSAMCDRQSKVFKKPHGASSAGGGHSFFTELVSSISDLDFSHNGRMFVTRDFMNLTVWDMAMEAEPLLSIPVHDLIKPKLCDLYENDSIFDKFECHFTADDSHVLTGSYSNVIRSIDVATGHTTSFQADKGQLKSKKKSSSSCNINIDDPNFELDFNRKILHFSLHPQQNVIGLAALSNLFIFDQGADILASKQKT